MSTTKVLPQTWPPFERAKWDERARSMLSSLSKMMGQEDCETPTGAVNSSVDEDHDKARRVIASYRKHRQYIVDMTKLHRNTIGGGNAGRNGRRECVAFLKRVLKILDKDYEDALSLTGMDKKRSHTESSDVSDESENVANFQVRDESVELTKTAAKKLPLAKEISPELAISTTDEIDFLDQHNDACEVCNQPGELLCCSTCNLVFHIDCVRPKLTGDPPDDWACAFCVADGVLGGRKNGALRKEAVEACAEMREMHRADKSWEAVSLEEGAASGCRKCARELGSGAKTSGPHDHGCPRKRAPKASSVVAKSTHAQSRTASEALEHVVKEVSDLVVVGSIAGRVTLEDAVKSGCQKCIEELRTGTKTKDPHGACCPRKKRRGGTARAEVLRSAKRSKERVDAENPRAPKRGKTCSISADEGPSAIRGGGEELGMDSDDETRPLPIRRGAGRDGKGRFVRKKEPNPSDANIPPTSPAASAVLPRELEALAIPTPLKIGKEHELTYSNNGRAVRSTKRPEWSGDDTSPEPVAIRGGTRSKRAKLDEASESGDRAPPPPKKGATKKNTQSGGKQNTSRVAIKKETNNNVSGIGAANRKPGTLFNCAVCLDLDKIKFCCFCACRVCFNKYAKEHTILCDRCNQEYHTFCVGLPGVPEGDWVCPACIDGDRKKVQTEKRRKEREARKKVDDERRLVADAKKAEAAAKRKAAKAEKKKLEEERKRVDRERRKAAADNRKQKEAEMRAAGIILPKKRGPGRPSKAEMAARLEAEQRHQEYLAAQSGPNKRGRGRPRKDGKDPIPRMFPSKSEISMDNLHLDIATAVGGQRSRSGRKIQRTIFHDEVGDSGGLSLVAERSAAVAAS